jgi:hypothetical protein
MPSKYEEYQICLKRNHQASGFVEGEWKICKWCGTKFKHVTRMVVKDIPGVDDGKKTTS